MRPTAHHRQNNERIRQDGTRSLPTRLAPNHTAGPHNGPPGQLLQRPPQHGPLDQRHHHRPHQRAQHGPTSATATGHVTAPTTQRNTQAAYMRRVHPPTKDATSATPPPADEQARDTAAPRHPNNHGTTPQRQTAPRDPTDHGTKPHHPTATVHARRNSTVRGPSSGRGCSRPGRVQRLGAHGCTHPTDAGTHGTPKTGGRRRLGHTTTSTAPGTAARGNDITAYRYGAVRTHGGAHFHTTGHTHAGFANTQTPPRQTAGANDNV